MVKPYLQLFLATIKYNILANSDSQKINELLDEPFLFLEIYSEKTKTWTHQYERIREKILYCVGSFMNKLYLIGKNIDSIDKSSSSCTYDFNSKTWN